MARPLSAALFLAAFRSNFYYAEFWDGASPLSRSCPPPNPRTECGFCDVAVAVGYYYYHKAHSDYC